MIGRLRISLGAIRRNAKLLRDMVGPKHAAFVVKSNAYGHGLLETARAAEPLARRICVYAFEEALALRSGGITKPILVLGPIPSAALDDVMAAKLDVALWDTGEFARRLARAARQRQTRAPVHVKVNTGLNRLGFEPHELADAVEDYLHVAAISISATWR